MPTLQTFVQISDLHLGHVDPNTLSSQYNALAPAHWALYKRCQGFIGHHYAALQQLSSFVRRLAPERPGLLVTGDLTSCGHPDQFNTARDFLGGTLHPPKGRDGLGAADWQRLTISGNHDQWPGTNRIFGAASPGLARYVRAAPFVEDVPLPGARVLRIVGLDTDVDVGPFTLSRFMAQGQFTSILGRAEVMLGPPDQSQVRILMLHHSRTYGVAGPFQPLVMKPRSRSALDQFLVANDVRVMLCGHTHAVRVKRHTATHPNAQRLEVLECCCGTTTQRDSIPYHWVNLLRQWPNWVLAPNTLLVHRLLEERGELWWRAERFVRKNSGFVSMGGRVQQIKVWP